MKRFLALFLSFCLIVNIGVVGFATGGQSNVSERAADEVVESTQVSYALDGSTVVETTRFIDFDNKPVTMRRTVNVNGSGELICTKNGTSEKFNLQNQDYQLFLKLATSPSTLATRGATVGSDVTGSQFKHVYVSTLNYTIETSVIEQIIVAGGSFAAGLVISALGLPGGIAVSAGSTIYSISTAISPSKMDIKQDLYEVHFSYDNAYYTHCYHETLKSYDSGGHLIDTTMMYLQAVGG